MKEAEYLESWPQPVLVKSREQQFFNISALPSHLKPVLWTHLKLNYPTLANLLSDISTDSEAQCLMVELDASLEIPRSAIPDSILQSLT